MGKSNFKKLEYKGYEVTLEVKLNYSEMPQRRGETGHTVIATGMPVENDDTTKKYHIKHDQDLREGILSIEDSIIQTVDTSLEGQELTDQERTLQELGYSQEI